MGTLSPSDWINLATSIGTFAAVAAALHVSRSSTSEAERQSLVRARIVAAGISNRLSALSTSVYSAYGAWHLNYLDYGEVAVAKDLLQNLEGTTFRIDSVVLATLAPLPDQCAQKIAMAFDLIDHVHETVERIARSEYYNGILGREKLQSCMANLHEAHRLLIDPNFICSRACELGVSSAKIAPLSMGRLEHIFWRARRVCASILKRWST